MIGTYRIGVIIYYVCVFDYRLRPDVSDKLWDHVDFVVVSMYAPLSSTNITATILLKYSGQWK